MGEVEEVFFFGKRVYKTFESGFFFFVIIEHETLTL
jgi:hypothetical protein